MHATLGTLPTVISLQTQARVCAHRCLTLDERQELNEKTGMLGCMLCAPYPCMCTYYIYHMCVCVYVCACVTAIHTFYICFSF